MRWRACMRHTCSTMLAIASGKGGVGKTWLSVTLAQALARSGQRVLLFDGDLGLANVDIPPGLQPHNDHGGVLDGSYALKAEVAATETGESVGWGNRGAVWVELGGASIVNNKKQ